MPTMTPPRPADTTTARTEADIPSAHSILARCDATASGSEAASTLLSWTGPDGEPRELALCSHHRDKVGVLLGASPTVTDLTTTSLTAAS